MNGNDLSQLTRFRALELFAGLGGFATACPAAEVVAAIDINRLAERTYGLNHKHPFLVREIESVGNAEFTRFAADFWWLSPPCQPFSRRGARRDAEDPRARPLLRLLDAIATCRPTAIGLENVVGFEESQTHDQLRQVLSECGYHVATIKLCPSQLGWPNRRPRFYLLATRSRTPSWRPFPAYRMTLRELLGDAELVSFDSTLLLDAEATVNFRGAIDRVDPADANAIAACFAGSYGKTLLHAGSYLKLPGGRYRRFTPLEVARIMGFPSNYRLDGLSHRAAWKLLGNSLSIPAVRYVLSHLMSR